MTFEKLKEANGLSNNIEDLENKIQANREKVINANPKSYFELRGPGGGTGIDREVYIDALNHQIMIDNENLSILQEKFASL